MTNEQLNTITARHAAATPGPYRWADWSVVAGNKENPFRRDHLEVDHAGAGHEPKVYTREEFEGSKVGVLVMKADYNGPDRDDDATFLAHSWQDTADLLAEVERLRGALAAIRSHIEEDGGACAGKVDSIAAAALEN